MLVWEPCRPRPRALLVASAHIPRPFHGCSKMTGRMKKRGEAPVLTHQHENTAMGRPDGPRWSRAGLEQVVSESRSH